MDVSKINTSVLRSLLKLTEKREALLEELKKVDAAIAGAYAGKAPASLGKVKAEKSAPKSRKGTGKRGALKSQILAALEEAGSEGVSVKDLSESLGVKNQNIHVWFSSTGRKLGNIQKVGAGRYRLKA